jgi:hypothetical protein
VKDVGVDSKHDNPATRIYLTSVAQPWHVDGVDMVGESVALLALQDIVLGRKAIDKHGWLWLPPATANSVRRVLAEFQSCFKQAGAGVPAVPQ